MQQKYTLERRNYVDTQRFIYLNVSKIPRLLDDGEWDWYIKNAGFDECTCSLKITSSDPDNIPHKDMLSLGI